MFASSVVWPEIAARKPHSVKIVKQNKLSKCVSVTYHRPQAGNDWVRGSFSSLCAAQNKFPNLPQKPQVLRNYKTPIQTQPCQLGHSASKDILNSMNSQGSFMCTLYQHKPAQPPKEAVASPVIHCSCCSFLFLNHTLVLAGLSISLKEITFEIGLG